VAQPQFYLLLGSDPKIFPLRGFGAFGPEFGLWGSELPGFSLYVCRRYDHTYSYLT